MPPSPTLLLARDELVGFAKSKVMIVMWVIMPLVALAGFLLLRNQPVMKMGDIQITAKQYMGLVESSIAGAIAAIMIAVDIVQERTRNVYQLFVIRPIKPQALLWGKFLAVTLMVIVAATISISIGFVFDLTEGRSIDAAELWSTFKALMAMSQGVGLACAGGVLFGVLARDSILVAVVLVLNVGQNFIFIPQIPAFFGVMQGQFWLWTAITMVIMVGVVWLAGISFRRSQF